MMNETSNIFVGEGSSPHYNSSLIGILFLLVASTMLLWGFAFLRLPSATPEWLLRAQYACFGSNEHGLPDAGGWLVLIGSPLSLLIALQFLYWGEISIAIRNFFTSKSFQLLAATIILIGTFEVIWIAGRLSESLSAQAVTFEFNEDEVLPETYPKLKTPIDSFKLTNQHGNDILSQDLTKPYFLTFVFAHCSTVCPTLIKNVEEASKKFNSDSIQALYITLDPWRDTPSALPNLAKQWKVPENHFILSGAPVDVNKVLDQFNVPRQRDEKNGDVVHPSLVYIVNANSQIVYAMNNASVDWLEQGMKRVLNEAHLE